MTDKIFVNMLAERLDTTKIETKRICEEIDALIKERISSGEKFKAFDVVYSVKDTAERNGVNPKTGEKLVIPAGKKVSLRACKGLKEIVK